jgi:hypothetical protein
MPPVRASTPWSSAYSQATPTMPQTISRSPIKLAFRGTPHWQGSASVATVRVSYTVARGKPLRVRQPRASAPLSRAHSRRATVTQARSPPGTASAHNCFPFFSLPDIFVYLPTDSMFSDGHFRAQLSPCINTDFPFAFKFVPKLPSVA